MNNYFILFIIIILFLEYKHYDLYVKDIKRDFVYKILYLIVDLNHQILMLSGLYLVIFSDCNNNKLLLLNILYLTTLFFFFIHKKCILTIIENKILNNDKDSIPISFPYRIKHIINNTKYKPIINKNVTIKWMNSHIIFISIIISTNLFCLLKNRL